MASTFTFRSQPWTSSLSANSSERPALYVVFVHTPVILPSASSRPCIAATPLLSANGLGFLLRLTRSGLSPPNYYPRRAHRKSPRTAGAPDCCVPHLLFLRVAARRSDRGRQIWNEAVFPLSCVRMWPDGEHSSIRLGLISSRTLRQAGH